MYTSSHGCDVLNRSSTVRSASFIRSMMSSAWTCPARPGVCAVDAFLSLGSAPAIDAVTTGASRAANSKGRRASRIGASGLGQAEGDVNRGARIDGLAVRLGGLEADADGRPLCRFVEAVPESAHHAQHADVAAGGELELERHCA